MKTTANKIQSLGWNLYELTEYWNGSSIPNTSYRACQGGFNTLYRPTPEQVLSDVEKIVNARKEQKGVPF